MFKCAKVKKLICVLTITPILLLSFCFSTFAIDSNTSITLNYNDFSLGYVTSSSAVLEQLSNGYNRLAITSTNNAEKLVIGYNMQDFLNVDDVYRISLECYSTSTSHVRILIGDPLSPSVLLPVDTSTVLFDFDTISLGNSVSQSLRVSKSWKMENTNTNNQWLFIEVSNLQSSTGIIQFCWKNFVIENRSQILRNENPNNALTETYTVRDDLKPSEYTTSLAESEVNSEVQNQIDSSLDNFSSLIDLIHFAVDDDFRVSIQRFSNFISWSFELIQEYNLSFIISLFLFSLSVGLFLFIVRR